MSKQELIFVFGCMSGFYIAKGDPEGITGIKWLDTFIFGVCAVIGVVGANYLGRLAQ